MQIEDIVDSIRTRAKRLGLTKSRLAVMADLHKNTLRDFYKPGWSPKLKTLQKLEAALEKVEHESR